MKTKSIQLGAVCVLLATLVFLPSKGFAAATPSITTQPVSQSVVQDSNAVFTVVATGQAPLVYQWTHAGTNLADSAHFAGTTGTNLIIASVMADDAGDYQVTVSNSHGSVTSSNATLTVLFPAAITSQPTNQSVVLSSNASFTVTADGTAPLTYQWQKDGVNLSNGGIISGATSATLNLATVDTNNAGAYQVVVTNSYGSITSAVATLTVLVPAFITSQSANQAVILTSNANFTVIASGTAPLSFQWLHGGTNLANGGRFSGATTATLSIANTQTNDAGVYQVVVSNAYGSVTSSDANLTLLLPPNITSQPINQSVLVNSNASFTATVVGDPPLSFQWYFQGAPLTDTGHVNGSTTTNLIISNLQTNDAGSYQLLVTNNYGTASSVSASLTVLVPAYITSQPTNRVALSGSNVNFIVTAAGTAPLGYLWYSNGVALSNVGRFSGVTTSNLLITGALTNDSAAYQVVAINNYGSVTSILASLTVLAPVQITSNPASRAVLFGSNVTFTVEATGSVSGYQWYFNGTPLSDGGRISGSTTPVLGINNVQAGDAGGYFAVASNLLNAATSRTASLTPQTVLLPSVRYVDLNCTNPLPPYLNWTTAATNIQDAIDASVNGDTILVTNGIYQTGGRAVYGAATNRVTVDKAVMVQSVNGPATTTIAGFNNTPNLTVGRCVYLTNGASLIGFTLINGGSGRSGDMILEQSGGGVWCESSSAVVSNCVITDNFAVRYGGGAFGGTLFNCMVTNNIANQGGGGCSNTLFHCTLSKNYAQSQNLNSGGGAYGCTLSNCLVVGNGCNGGGGGAFSSALTSCVVSNNLGNFGGGVALGLIADSLISSNRSFNLGGGAYSNTLNNCVLQNNFASQAGGGACRSMLYNCILNTNSSAYNAGGAYQSTLYNCLLETNSGGSSGGGAGGASQSTLYNCTLSGNHGWSGGTYFCTNYSCTFSGNVGADGGGANSGISYNCIFTGNHSGGGAGAMNGTLYNCLLTGNIASSVGGGVHSAVLYNCTVTGNTATNSGGGVYAVNGSVNNSIVYFNNAPSGPNWAGAKFNFSCTTPGTFGVVTTNDPYFVDSTSDFHLQSNSPCINAGDNYYVTNATDLDGNPRIAGGTVDIGAYEYQTPSSILSYAWAQQYGLPTDGSADYADTDGDGMNSYAEWKAGTIPTNAASVLQLASPSNSVSGVTVTWQSVSGIPYFVQRSTNLSDGFTSIVSNRLGSYATGSTSYTDTSATNGGPYFYRVGVP